MKNAFWFAQCFTILVIIGRINRDGYFVKGWTDDQQQRAIRAFAAAQAWLRGLPVRRNNVRAAFSPLVPGLLDPANWESTCVFISRAIRGLQATKLNLSMNSTTALKQIAIAMDKHAGNTSKFNVQLASREDIQTLLAKADSRTKLYITKKVEKGLNTLEGLRKGRKTQADGGHKALGRGRKTQQDGAFQGLATGRKTQADGGHKALGRGREILSDNAKERRKARDDKCHQCGANDKQMVVCRVCAYSSCEGCDLKSLHSCIVCAGLCVCAFHERVRLTRGGMSKVAAELLQARQSYDKRVDDFKFAVKNGLALRCKGDGDDRGEHSGESDQNWSVCGSGIGVGRYRFCANLTCGTCRGTRIDDEAPSCCHACEKKLDHPLISESTLLFMSTDELKQECLIRGVRGNSRKECSASLKLWEKRKDTLSRSPQNKGKKKGE